MYEELVKRLRDINNSDSNIKSNYIGLTMIQAADAIEDLLRKEKFHAFLWNVINPNDMQLYLEMYHSAEEKQEARE